VNYKLGNVDYISLQSLSRLAFIDVSYLVCGEPPWEITAEIQQDSRITKLQKGCKAVLGREILVSIYIAKYSKNGVQEGNVEMGDGEKAQRQES
jgi:hypothetical protein